MTELQIQIFVFVFGLCIGSFLNVCIYRIPLSLSIVRPPSGCPLCDSPIRFYDNLPVLSYIILLGKCRHCRAPISIRYPLVELLSGGFALCVYLKFGLFPEGLIYYAYVATLLTITFIDIDHQIIPDVISLPGIVLFFGASFAVSQVTMVDTSIGILAGGGSLYLVAWIYETIKKVDGMGGGDIKLLAMIGAMTGWKGVLFTIGASAFSGIVVGMSLMVPEALEKMRISQKEGGPAVPVFFRTILKSKIPYGPFLAFGSILYLFYGSAVLKWYLGR